MTDTTQEGLAYALDRMCSPLHESRLSGVTADADARCMEIIRQCISTLKAENAEWKRIADQAHAALAENKGAVHWKERASAAQSQAAAMAGLLEEARQKLDQWQGFFAGDDDVPEPPITLPTIIRIDAALSTWKENQK